MAAKEVAKFWCQGVALFWTPEKSVYGVVTLAINWIPGIPAAIHLISMYREDFPWYSTLLYAALLIGELQALSKYRQIFLLEILGDGDVMKSIFLILWKMQ